MRKLTVKNFSVIKEAELEFGKITVLIGPQSSGKSLLCKLAYFFQKVIVELAETSLRESDSLDTFRLRVMDEFVRVWFPAFGPEPDAQIDYEDGPYKLTLSSSRSYNAGSGFSKAGLVLSPEIEARYIQTSRELERERSSSGNTDFNSYARVIRSELERLQSSESAIYSYVPSTRAFFVTSQKAILGTSHRIDPITLRFSQDFSFDYLKRVPQIGINHDLTTWIDQESRRILKGEVVVRGNTEIFSSDDGRELPLSILSSGTQELLPLISCLREFAALSSAVATTLDLKEALHRRLFFVEEPEANIFPSTQYDLVRVFARMANEPVLDASWVITTHSPYILSSFNNLIEAGQAARNNPKLHDEVAKIIPEQYWIKEGDFKAFAIEDGKLKSILNESGFVEANYLDQVSEVIGDEFDKLLRLEYERTKAS